MKKTVLLGAFVMALLIITGDSFQHPSYSNGGGGPISGGKGYTGSTFDNRTCNTNGGCHTGPAATTQSASITSNVPGTGYVAGTTYTINCMLTTAATKAGFQATVMDGTGNLKGTLIATNTTETQLVGSSKYITHKSAGTTVTGGSKTWSFDWTAPAAATGTVTINGVFNSTDNNSASNGDVILTASLNISEDTGPTAISEAITAENSFFAFPNPASGRLTVCSHFNSVSSVYLTDIAGKRIPLTVSTLPGGPSSQTLDLPSPLPSGIYFLTAEMEGFRAVERILIAH